MQVPRLFIDGRYIGGEPEIQRLHESGELANILRDAGAISIPVDEPLQSPSSAALCDPSLTNDVPSGTIDDTAQYEA